MLESLITLAAGGILTLAGSYFQHLWKSKHEDRQREIDQKREDEMRAADQRTIRIQAEKDVVAELLGAMLELHSAITSLGAAYEAAAEGAVMDRDRARYYQDKMQRFGIVLARARLSVRNPAARPALDKLHDQWATMSNHLGLLAMGQRSEQFQDDFARFHTAVSEVWKQLELACLDWDGSLTSKDVESESSELTPPRPAGAS